MEKFRKNRSLAIERSNQTQTPTTNTENDRPVEKEKQKRYIVLPYVNWRADEFATRLTNLVNNSFPKVDMKVSFKAPNEIGKKFPFKDNIKK